MDGQEIIFDSKEQITDLGIEESGIKEIKKGAVLFSFKLSIGKVAFAGVDLFTNEAIAALIIKNENEVFPKYLFYAMRELDHTGTTDNAAMGKTLKAFGTKPHQSTLKPKLGGSVWLPNRTTKPTDKQSYEKEDRSDNSVYDQ